MKPLALLLAAAATPAGLTPGLYEITSTPGQATLNGQPLGDLPYTPPTAPERLCLTAAQARDPAARITVQVPAGCTVTRRLRTAASLTLSGTCRPQAPGLQRGSFRLTGRWTATGYQVDFATENPSENGRMGFTGRVAARRVGACPQPASTASSVSPA